MTLRSIALLLALVCSSAPAFGQQAQPVQVFILAGQSNMEGKAKMSLLEHQVQDPATADQFAHLRTDDGGWVVRDDVWIKFLERHGGLTVGYGSPNCIGPELEFGHAVGDHFEAPVLIIKTAWGGKSLYRDFRPPSAGMPSEEVLQQMLEQAQKRRPATSMNDIRSQFGMSYRLMVEDVRTTLERLDEYVPPYEGQGYEVAGLVWFQGWNDMINLNYTAEYRANMVHFIRDVRRDLKVADLPVVIGQLGVGGAQEERPNAKKDAFKQAQAQAAAAPELEYVALVRTDQYWDMRADAVYKKGWRENLQEWNTVGSDRPYHYLGSAICYSRIGKAFAEAIIQLHERR